VSTRTPGQPGDARDPSTPAQPDVVAEPVDEQPLDERIVAAIQRRFAPPNVWPPLFGNGEMTEAADGDREHQGDRALASEHVQSAQEDDVGKGDPERACHDRTRRSFRWRRLAAAACIALVLAGVGSVALLMTRPDAPETPIEVRRTIDLGPLFHQFAADGFVPGTNESFDDSGWWLIPRTPIVIDLTDAQAADLGIELIGTSECLFNRAHSPCVLLHVNGRTVLLLVGTDRVDYAVLSPSTPPLHVHHRHVGEFDVYELSSLESAVILPHLDCAIDDCEPEPYICPITGQRH
jgi:hypothetical protein